MLEYLSNYFKITVFYYNPNITEETEYKKRVAEQARLISELDTVYPIQLVEGTYDPQRFYEITKGMEQMDEGGERCFACYRLRLEEEMCIRDRSRCAWKSARADANAF